MFVLLWSLLLRHTDQFNKQLPRVFWQVQSHHPFCPLPLAAPLDDWISHRCPFDRCKLASHPSRNNSTLLGGAQEKTNHLVRSRLAQKRHVLLGKLGDKRNPLKEKNGGGLGCDSKSALRFASSSESESKPGIKMVVIPEPCFKK